MISEPAVRPKVRKRVADPGNHGMDGGEMGATAQAAIYTSARQITSIAHAHGERYCVVDLGVRMLWGPERRKR